MGTGLSHAQGISTTREARGNDVFGLERTVPLTGVDMSARLAQHLLGVTVTACRVAGHDGASGILVTTSRPASALTPMVTPGNGRCRLRACCGGCAALRLNEGHGGRRC
jgi:hypothetical protein